MVDLPPRRKVIENKWILKIKCKADGTIERYKVRLVTKGNTQEEGINYVETFSPVVQFSLIRLILAVVVDLDLELYQMGITIPLLIGEMEEEICMQQPTDFVVLGQEQ